MGKERVMIISSCSAGKDDSIPIPVNDAPVRPDDYIEDESLRSQFLKIRSEIFTSPESNIGEKITYAFNLYVRKGRAYKLLFDNHYESTLESLKRHEFEWLFLSGGYGLIHALEEGHSYQATFSRGIAYQNHIPYTGSLWKNTLPKVVDSAISRYRPGRVLVFGSRDYTSFIRATSRYSEEKELFEIMESYGSSGAVTLSPKIAKAVQSML